MKIIALNQQNLKQIAERVSSPTYGRSKLKTGIVHVGIGGFHRSHQAYYVHQLLEKHNTLDWGICGVGLREADRKIHDVFKKQDCLYTLVTQHPDGTVNSEVIGSIHDFLLAVDNPEAVVSKMADSDTKIVSLTITEGGYNFNPTTGEFDFENADIQHELQHPNEPKTIFGFLTAALKKRQQNGSAPFSILSCDNIQHNGDITRKMLLSFAEKQDPELANWIKTDVYFPNTMVDRITPVTTSSEIEYLQSTHGITDEWPVVCEPFIQWVVEDTFSNGRPPLEKMGVQFVTDVAPYEEMKIRLLNAGHSVLGITGAVYGHPTINACMADEVFAQFMRKFMDKEVSPHLDELEGIDIEKYKDSLAERFANPNIKDSVSRICSESSAKLPKFLIPTLQENLATGGSIEYATFILAAWCYYSDKGIAQNNHKIEIIDALQNQLHQAAKNTEQDPTAFLKLKDVFGDLVENERFVKVYTDKIDAIYSGKAIRELMKETNIT